VEPVVFYVQELHVNPAFSCLCYMSIAVVCSSAYDSERQIRVAIKKLARPFQSPVHAKRAYREIRMLKHMHHENVSCCIFFCYVSIRM